MKPIQTAVFGLACIVAGAAGAVTVFRHDHQAFAASAMPAPVASQEEQDRAAQAAGDAAAAPPADAGFTQGSFDAYANGKTKEDIRAAFGSPDFVSDGGETWNYNDTNPRLVVTDPDAGVRVHVHIQFAGIQGPHDFVASTSF